ncbi:hypothetical protein [Helicobacter zhangjianzhongii]|uniref:Uncharacterized protein n=1 Tax=Helicobacter zhangjianzhongii TaxID=2974574 RepID=A0ACC6FR08_9HELI|nr:MULTISPECIES: hypothetical protein [unclassified Helicobacter]MDL0079470.1 hypothetical protein [Helicobacter sp. CPD2-1]MDL0081629.1 hypothetical protein [Helicobacter sp. XJK30-2]
MTRDISPLAQYDNVKKWILAMPIFHKPASLRHREPCASKAWRSIKQP